FIFVMLLSPLLISISFPYSTLFRSVIIQLFKRMNEIRVEGERIHVQAGALLSKTAAAAREASLTGMEFASGIPGTLGGALRMNADRKSTRLNSSHVSSSYAVFFLK